MSKIIQISKEIKQTKTESNSLSPSEKESSHRIITKNLVYIIGLYDSIADKNILSKYEYLGQYGKILKIIINKKKVYNQNTKFGPSYSAYITYSEPKEASIAILSLDKTSIDGHLIRASFGTTKYCQYYLSKNKCNNKNCVFLHKKANPEDIINKYELNSNTNYFNNQQIYAIKIADVYNSNVKEKLLEIKKKNIKTIFPSPYLIYENNKIVIENTPLIKKINKLSIPKENKINEINNIERNLINTIKINELETSNSTITTSNCLTSSLSSRSNDGNSVSNNNLNNKLFSIREKSRFDFVNNNNNKEIEIPEFVSEINELSFKINYFINSYKKKDIQINESILYEDELNKVDKNNQNELNWKNFIFDNISN